mgnify:FL=1|jgi:hypothetical protein|tara:strand:- start:78 stop:335 length:258 start_codon:yes stop_codon:yes gene_type:complete
MENDWLVLIQAISNYIIELYLFEIVSIIVVGITYAIYQLNKGEKSLSLIFKELILVALYIIWISIIPFLLLLAFIFAILPEIGWV